MHKRPFAAALMLGCLWLPAICAAQQDFSDVKIEAIHVAGPIHMLKGAGGNIGVSVGPDGILMVDDQFAPLADRIRAAIGKLGEGKIAFVLNTHWHGDHVGGNTEFGREATIIAQTNVYGRLSTRQELFGQTKDPLPKHALPVITFDESLSVHFNGEEIEVIHFPTGHTDGDSAVFFKKSNVVHMGDLMFMGMFPFVDLDHGGDVEGLIRDVAAIIARLPKDAKVIPGHGPLSSVADLKTYHRMLGDCVAAVQKAMSAGQSLEQILKAGAPEEWESWGSGFIKTDKWLETIHKSLTKK